MIKHEKGYRDGKTLLTVRGEQGVVEAVIWACSGSVTGVIGVHASAPQQPHQQPTTCPILGHCYDAGPACRGGQEAAELYARGQVDAAFAEVESWYRSRLMHEE